MTDLAATDRVREYNKLWRRIERRSSEDPLSEDRLSPSGIITVAGVGSEGYDGDGGPARHAFLTWPSAVAAAPDGGAVILEGFGSRIRRITPDGTAETIVTAGCGNQAQRQLAYRLCYATDLAVSHDGTIFLTDAGARVIRRIAPNGTHHVHATFGDDPDWYGIEGIAAAPDGRIVVSDAEMHQIVEIRPNGERRIIAGNGTCEAFREGLVATESPLCTPGKMAFGPDGSLYVVENSHGAIRRIGSNGEISTAFEARAAGIASGGVSLDGIAIGPDGRLYTSEHRGTIYRIDAPHIAVPVAGSSLCSACGDGLPAAVAYVQRPAGIAFDQQGFLLIAESERHRIRLADVGAAGG